MTSVRALDLSHPVPPDALTAHLGVFGKTGSGKTYMAKGLVEQMLRDQRRVIIIDPTGVWWGLRSTADGRADGFSVAIFGGDHADVPISEGAGERLGALLAERPLSAIVDVSEFSNAGRARFMAGFLGELYRLNKRTVQLVIDEADAFAPQRAMPNETQVLHHVSQIVRRGRVKGFRCVLITQRPATISKDVITQVNAIVAMRVTAPQDRKALEEWIKGQADADAGKEVLDTLAKLDRGEGWVWAPEADVLKRAKFPRITTFDSSRAPEDGEAIEPETLADVDVDALREALGAEPEARPAAPAVDVAAIKKAAYDDGYREGRRDGKREGFTEGLTTGLQQAQDAIAAVQAADAPDAKAPPQVAPSPLIAPPPKVSMQTVPPTSTLTPAQGRVIEAVAFWMGLGFRHPSREQVAAVAGYSVGSGGFRNLLGGLRSASLIDYPREGAVTLTEAGIAIAPTPPATTARARLDAVLAPAQARIVDALHGRGAVSRLTLSQLTGYQVTSGGFRNLLGSLRTLGVIDYPSEGMVEVEPWVWA